MDKVINLFLPRFETLFEFKINTLGREKIIKGKFDTGAEATIIGLDALEDDKYKLRELEEKVKRNGQLVTDLNSFTGPILNVYELPVTELCINDIKLENISLCVALHTKKCLIGMDIVGLFDFHYNPTKHSFTYTQMRNWERNPKIRYAIARQIEEVNCKEDDLMYHNTSEPIHSVHNNVILSDEGILKEVEEIFGYTIDEDNDLE